MPRPSLDFEMVFTGGEVGSLAVANRCRVFLRNGEQIVDVSVCLEF